MRITSYVRLLRPEQWLKNVFVLLPVFFGGKLLDIDCWSRVLPSFIAFSLMASAVYCFNDVRDVEADRRHPKKCRRPVASGEVSVPAAITIMVLLSVAAAVIPVLSLGDSGWLISAIIVGYFALNIVYCLKLKYYAIIDVFVISTGFVLRLLCGGLSTGIYLSPWIVLMTFLLALFLAFAKRRDDVVMYERQGLVTRKNIVSYNIPFMNQTLGLIGTIAIVCYIIYTVQPDVVERLGSQYVYLTSLFVVAAILRYLQVAIVRADSGSPTKILIRDRFIQACLLGWGVSFMIILYL